MASIYLSEVEILSKDTVLVTFNEPLSTSASNYLASNYSIAGLVVRNAVRPLNGVAPVSVLLETDSIVVGTPYTLATSNVLSSSGNLHDSSVVLSFEGRMTKLDKALVSTPILYDTSLSSTIRQVLTAIHRENDKIGGQGELTTSHSTPVPELVTRVTESGDVRLTESGEVRAL